MIASVILHQMRVYFTAAYRRPRKIDWVIGMTLLMCTLLTGFTGYSLVFEQLSFWGATVAANISDAVPVVGSLAKRMLLAGETYNSRTLPRFFILHAAVLPTTMVLLIGIHIAFIRLHGVTELKLTTRPPSRNPSIQLLSGSLADRDHDRTCLDDPLECTGNSIAGHYGSQGRSADDARDHQTGMVLLCFFPLAEAILADVCGHQHRVHRRCDVSWPWID